MKGVFLDLAAAARLLLVEQLHIFASDAGILFLQSKCLKIATSAKSVAFGSRKGWLAMGRNSKFSGEQKIGCGLTAAMLLIFLSVVAIKSTGGVNWQFSEGSRSGVIQKLSKKGIIWKTWEGELNLGYNQSHVDENGHQTIAPAMFYFSVSDDAVAKKLKTAEIVGKRVTVDYNQYFLRGWDKGGTAYDVTGAADASSLVAEQN